MSFAAQHKEDAQKQSITLVSHLAIVVIVVTCFFWVLTRVIDSPIPSFIFIILISIGAISYLLNWLGYHRIAAIFGLISFNIAVYSIASSETSATGLHVYLGCAAFAALVIFGYENRLLGFSFFLFSILLFLLCIFSDYSPLPERHVDDLLTKAFYVCNSISFACICVYLFYLVLRLNHRNETILRKNEWRIKQQNEELIKTNEELDRFVYSASHDLRAPLSSISGLVTLASHSSELTEVQNYISLIKGRAEILDKFILDIISYSRNARTETTRETIILPDLIHEIIDGLQYMPGVEDISFRFSDNTTIEFNTDSTRLRMVLNNLIGNAIRYHDPFKREKFIEIKTEKTEEEIVIYIQDNGTGIDEEHHDKIFNMFYKASENKSGSGLGLYIAQEAILKLGGTIRVHSELGKGTTFMVRLPILPTSKINN